MRQASVSLLAIHDPLRRFGTAPNGSERRAQLIAAVLAADQKAVVHASDAAELPWKPRLLLDTNVVRHLGAGSCDPRGLLQFAREGGSVHLADGAVAELVRQLDSGELLWSEWERARSVLARLLDKEIPVMLGGRELLGAVGISICAARPSIQRAVHIRIIRQLWHVLRLAAHLDDLRSNDIAVQLPDRPEMVALNFDHVDEAFRAEHHGWVRSFARLRQAAEEQHLVIPGRGDHPALIESQVRSLGKFIDDNSAPSVPPVSTRLDAMIRVHCLLTLRALRQKDPYNAKKKVNDKFDHDLLRYLGLPAAVCTADDGLFRYLEASRSWQIKWVVRPAQLLEKRQRRALLDMRWPSA